MNDITSKQYTSALMLQSYFDGLYETFELGETPIYFSRKKDLVSFDVAIRTKDLSSLTLGTTLFKITLPDFPDVFSDASWHEDVELDEWIHDYERKLASSASDSLSQLSEAYARLDEFLKAKVTPKDDKIIPFPSPDKYSKKH